MGFSLVYLGPKEKREEFKRANPEVRETILPSFREFLRECKEENKTPDELWEDMRKLAKIPIEEPNVLEFPLFRKEEYTIGSKEKYFGWPIKPNYGYLTQKIKEEAPLEVEQHITIPGKDIPKEAVKIIQRVEGGEEPLHHPYGVLEIKNLQNKVPVLLDNEKLGSRKARHGSVLKIGDYSFLIEEFIGTELDRLIDKRETLYRIMYPSRTQGGEPIIY